MNTLCEWRDGILYRLPVLFPGSPDLNQETVFHPLKDRLPDDVWLPESFLAQAVWSDAEPPTALMIAPPALRCALRYPVPACYRWHRGTRWQSIAPGNSAPYFCRQDWNPEAL